MHDRASRELARQWDGRDPLARFRKQFYRPAGQIYLDGGSLGLCSQEAERALLRLLGDWKTKASAAFLDSSASWSALPARLATRLAYLLGATPNEIAIGGSTGPHLQQLLATLYRRQFHRPCILLDAFSSHREAIESHLALRGLGAEAQLITIDPARDRLLDEAKLEAALADPNVQMAILPTVVSATGQLLDVARLCRVARHSGTLIGLDLSHSLGVMPHALDEWGADFAIWNHERFSGAGPGAAAGFYLSSRHFHLEPQIGEPPNDRSARGAMKLQLGPPPILSLALLDGALRPLEEAGVERTHAKSLDLVHFLRAAIEGEIPSLRFATPREATRRGGHLAVIHPEAQRICQLLQANGVTADFREPDIICLAPAPLYNSFVECWDAVQILRRVLPA